MKLAIYLLFIKASKCSVIVDSHSQNWAFIKEYCETPNCPKGTHVMCMYYNPNSVMGPKCYNSLNISVTPEIATKLLDVTNAIRSKIALGVEKGNKNENLPRGYGIFKLEWDNELATFAQVLANQCVLQHDLCRATKRFPHAGQTAGKTRFSYPDWYPVSKVSDLMKPGPYDAKILYAANLILKSWYSQKNVVTPSMVTSYPDWKQTPKNTIGRLYLEMIYGPAEYMGCGISAYTDYTYYDNKAALIYNSVLIICNFATRPYTGQAVYNTTKPTAPGYTVRCGCPPDSDEDENCLCIRRPMPTTEASKNACTENDLDCKEPAVVVLPIFTIEDAPQNKLIKPPVYTNVTRRTNDDPLDIIKQYENRLINRQQPYFIQRKKTIVPITHIGTPATPIVRKQAISRTLRLPENKLINVNQKEVLTNDILLQNISNTQIFQSNGLHGLNNRRPSIFTKVQQFHLPFHEKFQTTQSNIQHPNNDISFSKVPLTNKVQSMGATMNKISNLYNIDNTKRLHASDTLNNAEQKVVMHKNHLNKGVFKNMRNENVEQNNVKPKKLIHLLDTLEKEIKTVDIKGNEKQLIYAKIRKIYGSVIGHENLLHMERNRYSKLDNQNDIHNFIDETHDFNADYDFDNEHRRKLNFDTNLRHVDKITRVDVDNIYNRGKQFDFESDKDLKDDLNNPISNTNRKRNQYNKDIIDNDMYRDHTKIQNDYEDFGINNDEQFKRDYDDDINHNEIKRNLYIRNRNNLQRENYYDNNIGPKNTYRTSNRRRLKNLNTGYKRRAYDTYKNNDDPLDPSRRKYYQDRLDRLQRRKQNYAQNKRRYTRPLRPMRPTM